MMEEWKDIADGSYSVSSLGSVRSNERKRAVCGGGYRTVRERFLKASPDKNGYPRVNISGRGAVFVHKLVAEAFIPNPDGLWSVNHKDLDKTNNCVENLEWSSNSDNVKHAWENGAMNTHKKVLCKSTGETYESIHDAARSLGMAVGNLCSHLKGRQKTFAGAVWQYADE